MLIQDLAAKHNLNPAKLRGQNFLLDQNVVRKIMASADLRKEEAVLEVGPGFGVLTRELVRRAGKVVAVEWDKKIFGFLRTEFKEAKNLDLIQGDILKMDARTLNLQDYKIVANLPYSISACFLKKFLSEEPKPKEMIVMLQKEVGERIAAKPGKMSLLSLAVQFYAQPEILFPVSRNCFWPEPKVDSAVLRIMLKKGIPFNDEEFFFRMAIIGFSARRKQLQNNLANGLHQKNAKIREILISLDLNEKVRPQDLSLEDWVRLSKVLIKQI